MPPRKRRDGYRPGELSAKLRDALAEEVLALAALPTAVARIDASSDVLAAVDEALEEVRDVRLAAVDELRLQGWSAGRLAAATSLSSSRMKQLLREARARAVEVEEGGPAGGADPDATGEDIVD